MFNLRYKKKNTNNLSPNFLSDLDSFVTPKIEAKKVLKPELKKNIVKEKKPFIKKKIDREVFKRLDKQHLKFDQELAYSDKKIKKFKFIDWTREIKKISRYQEVKVSWLKSLAVYFFVLLLLVIPLKILADWSVLNPFSWQDRIVSRSKSAVDNLIVAGEAVVSLDIITAQNRFVKAGNDFLQADDDMAFISDTVLSLASLSSNPKLKLAAESKKFIKIGILVSGLGEELSKSLRGLNNNDGSWIKILDDFNIHGQLALTYAKELQLIVAKIDINNLPLEYQDKFKIIISKINYLPDSLSLVLDNTSKLKTFLGSGQDKRYLLIFQNNSEMRGSGGFLGSYALIDFREGKIRNLEVPGGGSYDTEAGLIEKIKAPEPLWLVNPQWHFWDANWWPDFPTTAKNLMWFYEKSDGPSVDGVISFTPSVVEKLLLITGPIDLTKDYGLIITADNFWQQVQLTTERDNVIKNTPEVVNHLPAGEINKPKKIIGDLMAKILEVLPQRLDKDNLVKLLSISEESLASKQIMFYFKDKDLQQAVIERNWGGVMSEAPGDYLMIANTNIAGAKTDRVIKENILHETFVSLDGSITNRLTVTRTHTAHKNEPLVGVRNVNWLRVYVPQGSQLLSASGFSSPDQKYFETPDVSWLDNEFVAKTEGLAIIDQNSNTKVYQENGKTVFANWLMVDPGETVTVVLEYKLPFNFWQKKIKTDFLNRLNNWLSSGVNNFYAYSLLIQKQPGANNETINTKLNLPLSAKIIWQSTDNFANNLSLDQDIFYSALLTNK